MLSLLKLVTLALQIASTDKIMTEGCELDTPVSAAASAATVALRAALSVNDNGSDIKL